MSAWALFDHPDITCLVVIERLADMALMGRNRSKMTQCVVLLRDFGAARHGTCAVLVAPRPYSLHHASDTMARPLSLGRLTAAFLATSRLFATIPLGQPSARV